MNLKRIFLYTLIGSVAICALIGIGIILFGSFGELESRVLMTTFTITLTSILGLACGAYFEAKQAKILPFAGIIFSILAAILSIYLVWAGDHGVTAIWKMSATLAMLATACALLCLISLATLDIRFMWSRYTIYFCVTVLVGILLYILWLEPDSSGEIVSRIIGVLGIIIAALTVVTPVFHKLSDTVRTVEQIRAEIEELEGRIYRLNQESMKLQDLGADD